ncbi:hypothetical protein F5Y17DRAFT_428749 [Xylariaceae sp. FL0594]|nr:hypothetical protein F5Y17DRAFT_428749 [Xylariaceae sp. FL0594]
MYIFLLLSVAQTVALFTSQLLPYFLEAHEGEPNVGWYYPAVGFALLSFLAYLSFRATCSLSLRELPLEAS